ncbi:MAG TPA: SbmA/BacA-like family transporter, partial [Candidatus Obscuribacter sp.]|nr:SbmA/BacA-like family transporter [Candidatus Obscuribacter sp.]
AGLTAARHNAHEIACGGESSETEELQKAKNNLNSVIETLLGIALVNRRIQFFTTPFNLFVQLIPIVIVVPSYFAGEIPFGTITQAAMAFGAVFNGATVLIGQFNGITHYAAITNRLGSLAEAMERSQEMETEKVETAKAV